MREAGLANEVQIDLVRIGRNERYHECVHGADRRLAHRFSQSLVQTLTYSARGTPINMFEENLDVSKADWALCSNL